MRLLGILSADRSRDSALRGVASAGGPLVPRADGALKCQQRADGERSEDDCTGVKEDARDQMEGGWEVSFTEQTGLDEKSHSI